jgi:thiamine-monophosphate kinase
VQERGSRGFRKSCESNDFVTTEIQIIERIRKRFGAKGLLRARWMPVGVGDDAAVLHSPSRGFETVLSCDSFLEGVHFLPGIHPPEAVGYKVLARATSDLAAMGARPRYFLMTLALPKERAGGWLDGFVTGLVRAAREFGMVLAGGDTSEFPSVAVSLTVGGEVRSGRALRRSGARVGDQIFISGVLGAAQLGLELILRGILRNAKDLKKPVWRAILAAHLYPEIHVRLGRWLAGGDRGAKAIASSAIDTSDGLSSDLARVCEASEVGARIWIEKLPTVEIPDSVAKSLSGVRRISGGGRSGFDPIEMALHGGDDYQLLFTVPAKFAARIPAAYRGVRLTRIGEIARGHGIEVVDSSGKTSRLQSRGWDSFRE